MTRWRTRRGDWRSDAGAAAVEFAIVSVLLLAIIFAIIDFGRMFFVVQSVQAASREGARYGVVGTRQAACFGHPGASRKSGRRRLASLAASSTATQVNVYSATDINTPSWGSPLATTATGCASGMAAIKVSVTVSFKWLTPLGAFVGLLPNPDAAADPDLTNTRPIVGTTTMRCEALGGGRQARSRQSARIRHPIG